MSDSKLYDTMMDRKRLPQRNWIRRWVDMCNHYTNRPTVHHVIPSPRFDVAKAKEQIQAAWGRLG